MKAHEIMTSKVITVRPDTNVDEAAKALVDNRISAAPVVGDDERVVGILSESDLCHRAETSTGRKRKWWLELFTDRDKLAVEYTKMHGLKAEDVMSGVVISVTEDAELGEIADILDAHRIRRVPVLRDGKLVGLVSRSDLVRALTQVKVSAAGAPSDNGTVHRAIMEKIRDEPWLKAITVSVSVKDDVIELWGVVDSEEQKRGLRVLVESVSGGREIEDHVQLYPKMTAA